MSNYEFRFNSSNRRRTNERNYEELKRLIEKARRHDDEDEDEEMIANEVNFADMKILRKRDGQKALTHGKVLNATAKKKYRRWRKHDRKVIEYVLKNSLSDLVDMGMVKKKKAKKIRKAVSKRILNCFYVKPSED